MPRILVVDDRPDVRLSLLYMLEASGFLVAEAGDGAQALDCLVKQEVDVVLTDLYMPGMDGLSLIKAIHAKPAASPIIAMTGSDHLGAPAALEAASLLGADAILTKPFKRAQLIEKIHDVCRSRGPES